MASLAPRRVTVRGHVGVGDREDAEIAEVVAADAVVAGVVAAVGGGKVAPRIPSSLMI